MLSYRDFLEAKNENEILDQAMADVQRIFAEIRNQMTAKPQESGVLAAEKQKTSAMQDIRQQLANTRGDFNSLYGVVSKFLAQHNISFPDAMDQVQKARRYGSHLERPLDSVPDEVWDKIIQHIQPMRVEAVENDFLALKEKEVMKVVSNVYNKLKSQFRAGDEESTYDAIKRALKAHGNSLQGDTEKGKTAAHNLRQLAGVYRDMRDQGFAVYYQGPGVKKWQRFPIEKIAKNGEMAERLLPKFEDNRFVQIRMGRKVMDKIDLADETQTENFIRSLY